MLAFWPLFLQTGRSRKNGRTSPEARRQFDRRTRRRRGRSSLYFFLLRLLLPMVVVMSASIQDVVDGVRRGQGSRWGKRRRGRQRRRLFSLRTLRQLVVPFGMCRRRCCRRTPGYAEVQHFIIVCSSLGRRRETVCTEKPRGGGGDGYTIDSAGCLGTGGRGGYRSV